MTDIPTLRAAGYWYVEKAMAMHRYMEAKPPQAEAMEAVCVELSLDNGARGATLSRLVDLAEAARNYMDAEVRENAHQTTCKNGCTAEGAECEDYALIWMDMMKARAAFWKSLTALGLS